MLFDPKHEDRLDALEEQLRRAPALTPDLISNVIADACTRLPVMKRAGKAARIDQLIEAGAWSDAALALIELELPAWKLRRLVYEDGEWHCSLSRHPNLPAALDDTADASHEVLPLAILAALIEAHRMTERYARNQFADGAASPVNIRLCNLLRQLQLSPLVMPKWWEVTDARMVVECAGIGAWDWPRNAVGEHDDMNQP